MRSARYAHQICIPQFIPVLTGVMQDLCCVVDAAPGQHMPLSASLVLATRVVHHRQVSMRLNCCASTTIPNSAHGSLTGKQMSEAFCQDCLSSQSQLNSNDLAALASACMCPQVLLLLVTL
jgi:hypothetical protein